MSKFARLDWDFRRLGPMTEATIRRLYNDPTRHRVSRYAYEANDEVEGTSRECTVYVLDGSIQITAGETSEPFARGDVFRFAGGDYVAKADALKRAELIWVWVLPVGIG
jgi:hypothetical protein